MQHTADNLITVQGTIERGFIHNYPDAADKEVRWMLSGRFSQSVMDKYKDEVSTNCANKDYCVYTLQLYVFSVKELAELMLRMRSEFRKGAV